ncbi:hypothetical protein BDV06DRAFT_194972 [Aspergillus oleicola]
MRFRSPERIIPPGGMEICGRYIPAGSTVGCLQRIIHLNQNVYSCDSAILSYSANTFSGTADGT